MLSDLYTEKIQQPFYIEKQRTLITTRSPATIQKISTINSLHTQIHNGRLLDYRKYIDINLSLQYLVYVIIIDHIVTEKKNREKIENICILLSVRCHGSPRGNLTFLEAQTPIDSIQIYDGEKRFVLYRYRVYKPRVCLSLFCTVLMGNFNCFSAELNFQIC